MLCLVGRFMFEGVIDFMLLKPTRTTLWRSGKGVFIKEVNVNLYLFQFYHEVVIKRVLHDSPRFFNRKVLVITRMKKKVNPWKFGLMGLNSWASCRVHN